MKAAIRTGLLGATLSFSNNHPLPSWDAQNKDCDETVYIKVKAAGMNPVDYKVNKLMLGPIFGVDVCGTVEGVGSKVSSGGSVFRVGDTVIGPAQCGSMAEFTICSAGKIAKLPEGWSVEEGAAVPVAYATAMTGLELAGVLQSYKENPEQPPVSSLLVIGASGGTGVAGLHLAKGLRIPRIVAICSSKNAEFCRYHGATEIVAYDDLNALDMFCQDNEGKIDLVYDCASFSGGGEAYSTNPKILSLLKATPQNVEEEKEKPSYLVLNGSTGQWLRTLALGSASLSDKRICLYLTKHSTEYLELVFQLLSKADRKPVIDSTWDFTKEGVEQGYDKLKSRRAQGKLVVKMQQQQQAT